MFFLFVFVLFVLFFLLLLGHVHCEQYEPRRFDDYTGNAPDNT